MAIKLPKLPTLPRLPLLGYRPEGILGLEERKEEPILKMEVGEGMTPEGKALAEQKIRQVAAGAPPLRFAEGGPLFQLESEEKIPPILPELAPKEFIGKPESKIAMIANTILNLPETTFQTLPFTRLLRQPAPKLFEDRVRLLGNEAVDFVRGLATWVARAGISAVSLLKDEPIEQQIKSVPFLEEVPTYERSAYEQLLAGVSPLEVGIGLAAEVAVTAGILAIPALRGVKMAKPAITKKTIRVNLTRQDLKDITAGAKVPADKMTAFQKATEEGIKLGTELKKGKPIRVKIQTPNVIGEVLYRPVGKGLFDKIIYYAEETRLPDLPQLPGLVPITPRPRFGLRGLEIEPMKPVGKPPAEKGIMTTDGIKHLDPKEYGDFTTFVRDIEKLNDATRPVDEIELAKKLWGNKPKQIIENINPKSVVLAEEPLKVLPKAGKEITEPIIIEVIDGVPTLVDGRHRLAQAIANGQKTIPAKISGKSKIPTISKGIIPQELQSLAQEARKYKSAEEFVGKTHSKFVAHADTLTAAEKKMADLFYGLKDKEAFYNQAVKGVKEVKPEIIKPAVPEKAFDYVFKFERADVYYVGKEIPPPNEEIIKSLSKYKPLKPITLYKGLRQTKELGYDLAPSGYQSWTKDRKIAEKFGKVQERIVAPEEILVDTTMIPRDEFRAFMEKNYPSERITIGVEKEVIVKIVKPPITPKPKSLDKIITEEAQQLMEMEVGLRGGFKMGAEGLEIRTTEHSPTYSAFYKEHGYGPKSLENWKEIAERELMAGRSATGQAEAFRAIKGVAEEAVEEIDVKDLFSKIEEDAEIKRLAEKSLVSDAEKKEFLKTLNKDLRSAIQESIEKNRWLSPAEVNGVGRALMTFLRRGTLEPERQFLKTETQLLKDRIRAEARGTRAGYKVARQITRKELINAFKDSAQKARDTRAILREYIQQEIPLDEQGKFLTALTNDITKKKQVKILSRVEVLKEQIKIRQLVSELKEVPRGNIAVDYQKKIKESLADIDLVKPTERTLAKLRGLKDYISREGIPLGISQSRIDALDRLTKKNIATMTPKELEELRNTIEVLRKLGKLKYDLKFKYNQRERKVALDKLLASSRNIDPPVKPIEGKLGTIDTYKVGTTKLYYETLTPARVADTIDGFKNYTGENAKYVKRLVAKETQAKKETQEIVIGALTEVQELGIKELTPEQQIRMMINIRHREGAYDQVQTLLERNKMTEIPKITEAEEKIIEILRKYTNKHTDDIAAISEEIENKIFKRIDGYVLPLKYEGEFNILPSETIEQTRYRTTQTFKGFIYGRQKGVTKTPRTDIFGIFDEAINEQQWYIRMQPELENIKYLVKSKEYVEKAGELASNTFWRSYMDVVARRGWSATAGSNPMLRSTRINIGQAVLGYKLTSFVMQPFAIFDAVAYAQSKYGATAALEVLKEFSKSWLNPKYAQRIIAESPALQVRKGGEVAIEEIYDALKIEPTGRIAKLIPPAILKRLRGYKRKGLVALQWADVTTAAGVQQGIENVLIKRGIADTHEEAEFLMNMVSASSEVTMRPLILSKGEGARTVFTFQTFFLNRWGLTIHDLIRSGLLSGKLTANWGRKLSALIGLAIMMAANVAEWKARKAILDITTDKKRKAPSTLSLVLTAIPEQIPLLGNMISSFINYGNAGFDFPLARQVENIIAGLGVITKEKAPAKIKAGLRAVEAAITIVGGIPGTTQFFDILEGIFFKEEKKEKGGMGLPGLPALPSLPKLPSLSF